MMAPSSGKPPDVAKINYICHPGRKVNTVVCLLCDSVYHEDEFSGISDTQYITSNLVICHEHLDFNITSKLDITENTLCDSARKLIAQIKCHTNVKVKNQILAQLDVSEVRKNKDETETEILLLKQLNQELQEKNMLLKDLLAKEREAKQYSKTTPRQYSEVVANTNPQQQKRPPKLKIKKINKNDKTKTQEQVTKFLSANPNIQTKSINKRSEDEIIINCADEKSVSVAEEILTKSLSNNFSIEKEQMLKPKVKVVGIDNTLNYDLEALEKDINQRNFNEYDEKCKAVYSYENKMKLHSVILEVPAEIYKHIKQNREKIYVGYQQCKVYDVIDIKPCFKCGRFGHNGKKCENEIVCLQCAGAHDTKTCNNSHNKCTNCLYSNATFKTTYNANHQATDTENCTILKKK